MCNYVICIFNFLFNDVCCKYGVLYFKVKLRKLMDVIRFNLNLQKIINLYKIKVGIGYEYIKIINVFIVEDVKFGVWILFDY